MPLWRCPVLTVLHRIRAGAHVSPLFSTDANSVRWRGGRGRAPGGRLRGRDRGLRRGALPGRPRGRTPPLPGRRSGCGRVHRSPPGSGWIQNPAPLSQGPAPERPERSGPAPPRLSRPGFPELSWSGAAPGDVLPGLRGWGLPQLPHPGWSGARLRGTARRPEGGAVPHTLIKTPFAPDCAPDPGAPI